MGWYSALDLLKLVCAVCGEDSNHKVICPDAFTGCPKTNTSTGRITKAEYIRLETRRNKR